MTEAIEVGKRRASFRYAALGALGTLVGVYACGSSSGGSPGTAHTTDGGAVSTDDGSSSADADDAAVCTVAVDASLANYTPPYEPPNDAGVSGPLCWSCLQGGCTTQIDDCSKDCTCNGTVLKGANCLASDAGELSLVTCVLPLLGGTGLGGFLTGLVANSSGGAGLGAAGGSGINPGIMNLASCAMAAGCFAPCGLGGFTTADGGFPSFGLDGGFGFDAGGPGVVPDSGEPATVDAGADGGAEAGASSSDD